MSRGSPCATPSGSVLNKTGVKLISISMKVWGHFADIFRATKWFPIEPSPRLHTEELNKVASGVSSTFCGQDGKSFKLASYVILLKLPASDQTAHITPELVKFALAPGPMSGVAFELEAPPRNV